MSNWLLYGAYGYTGRLIVEEALKRGHRPTLAGRNAGKLQALGEQHDLEWLALDLDYAERLRDTVERFDLVFHAAGPFIHTAEPMVQACLAGRTHYLDITGEIPVFEMTLSYDAHAREQGVVLVSGAGFDIVPTDCLAKHVADQLPDAVHLETAVTALSGVSAGTTKSLLEMTAVMPKGGIVRRNGRLVSRPLGADTRKVTFSDGKTRTVTAIPWGDLAAAEITTGIPNVTSYLALKLPPGTGTLAPLGTRLMSIGAVRGALNKVVDALVRGPNATQRETSRSYAWARATDADGNFREAWLETMEAYRFTAVAGVHAVETVQEHKPSGALTPALALGSDFVLELEDTARFDTLPTIAA